jgi:hypothetical protein
VLTFVTGILSEDMQALIIIQPHVDSKKHTWSAGKKLTLHFFLLNQSRGLEGSNFSTS